MQILSCHIENYGRLHDLSFSFSDGLNQVFAENGSGKTTLLSFLHAMLYGLPAGTKTNPQENERRHYTPWQGGRFGGSITFLHNGKTYTAVRFFGEKESRDSFELYRADTQLLSKDFTENLGYELFAVDSDSFQKSVFFPAYMKDPFSSRGATVTEKLSRYVEDSKDTVSFEDAQKTLEKQRKVYIKTGNKGLLPETEAAMQDVTLRRLQAERDRERAHIFDTEIAELEKERASAIERESALAEEILALGKEESGAALHRFGEGLYKTSLARAEALSDVRRSFGEEVPDANRLEEAAAAAYRLENTPPPPPPLTPEEEDELSRLDTRFSSHIPTEEELVEDIKASLSENRTHAIRIGRLWLLLFVLLSIPTATLWLLHPLYSVACGCLAIAFLALFLGGIGARRRRSDKAFLEKASEATSLLSRYRLLLEKQAVGEKQNEAYRNQTAAEEAALLSYAASYGEKSGTLGERFRALTLRYARYTRMLLEAKEAESALASFRREHGEPAPIAPSSVTSEEKQRERMALRRRLEAIDASLDEKRRLYLPIRENIARIDEYCAEEARLAAMAELYRKKASAIENAETFLLLAKDRLSTRYLSDMQKRYEEILARFLPHLSEKPVLSADLALKMKNGSARLSPLYMSDGIQDILAFSMHMALGDALFENGLPPLFLDDPFALWDDEKTAAGLSFLREEAGRRQVFYSTCQSSRLSDAPPALSL